MTDHRSIHAVSGLAGDWRRPLWLAGALLVWLGRAALAAQFTPLGGLAPVNDGGHSFAVSWADYDDDGYPDLFVGNWTTANCLYHNNGDGTFTKITSTPISSGLGTISSAWADYDDDGDLDAYMANAGTSGAGRRNGYYRNDGGGAFTEVLTGAHLTDALMSQSAAPADYDRDGDIDLYVVNHCPPPRCTGVYNQFFRNDGAAGFSLLGQDSLGMDKLDRSSASWADFDGDGDPDLGVAAGMRRCAIMQNDGDGTFTTVTAGALAADSGACGFSWGDYDNDRDLDVFAAHSDGTHNCLYRNLGGGAFEAVTGQDIVSDVSWSEGACWGDYDNDGDLDLFVANNQYYQKRLAFLYRNDGDGTFTRVTDECVATELHASTSGAWADYDRDGDLDLFVANCYAGTENNSLYRNEGNGNHWLSIGCRNGAANSPAIGARVSVQATIAGVPVRQMREVSGQDGFHSQSSLEAHFGLGDAVSADTVEVRWPDGHVQIWRNVAADQFLTLTDDFPTGVETAADLADMSGLRLGPCRPNPFRSQTGVDLELTRALVVRVTMHDSSGRLVVRLLGDTALQAGTHRLRWDGRSATGRQAAPGVYFLRVAAGGHSCQERVVLIQ